MPYRIALVSDFFHPNVGGVESSIYQLAVGLLKRGHVVIIITHTHPPSRVGIRHLYPGIKVYHLPLTVLTASATLPNFMSFLPYLRNVLLREHIDLVHGHASLSSMAHECVMHAPMMGVRTVMTDHSLFGFGDATGILTNKLLRGALRNADGVICVSHTGRENTVLRAALDPSVTHVIPNAVLPSMFPPDPSAADPDWITIVVVSRLVYRKGVDLLVASAPHICRQFPDVRFLIGGEGPKMVELEQMREKHLLQDRIELLGNVAPGDVHSVLTRGQIFLNTSLTEAFGIAILEAATTGLLVVSTRVGGVPEILPEDMIVFAQPDEDDVVRSLSSAIHRIRLGQYDPHAAHARVQDMYSWGNVAERTEAVYRSILEGPEQRDTFERMIRLLGTGPVFGLIMVIIFSVQHLFFYTLEWLFPREDIDYVPIDLSLDKEDSTD